MKEILYLCTVLNWNQIWYKSAGGRLLGKCVNYSQFFYLFTYALFLGTHLKSDRSADFRIWWLKRRGFAQGCAFLGLLPFSSVTSFMGITLVKFLLIYVNLTVVFPVFFYHIVVCIGITQEGAHRVHIYAKLHRLRPDRNFKFHLCPESHIAYLYICVVLHFCTLLLNSHFDLEPDYIIRMPIKRRFQWYIVCTEIFVTFHARVEYISRRTIRHFVHSNQWDWVRTDTDGHTKVKT